LEQQRLVLQNKSSLWPPVRPTSLQNMIAPDPPTLQLQVPARAMLQLLILVVRHNFAIAMTVLVEEADHAALRRWFSACQTLLKTTLGS
jgi:hypothetical protein